MSRRDATWDRLGEHLEKASSGKGPFIINRSFEASIDHLFEMWTDPKHLMRWLAPTGSTMEFIRADIRPGGRSFYSMTMGNGGKLFGRTTYIEIVKPHRLVYTQQFVDESEAIARHPMAPTWPQTMLTTVTFTEEGADQTRVNVKWDVHGPATAEEVATFVKSRGGMTQGWTGSFDQLDEALAG